MNSIEDITTKMSPVMDPYKKELTRYEMISLSSPVKNPYKKTAKKMPTQYEKLCLSQKERGNVNKLLAFYRRELKRLESLSEVKDYIKACSVVGSGNVQQYLSANEESEKLETQLIAINKEIELYQTGPLGPSMIAVVTPEKINDLNMKVHSKMLPLALGFNLEEENDEFSHPYDTLSDEEMAALPLGLVQGKNNMSDVLIGDTNVVKCNSFNTNGADLEKSDLCNDTAHLNSVDYTMIGGDIDDQICGSNDDGIDPIVRAKTLVVMQAGRNARAKLAKAMNVAHSGTSDFYDSTAHLKGVDSNTIGGNIDVEGQEGSNSIIAIVNVDELDIPLVEIKEVDTIQQEKIIKRPARQSKSNDRGKRKREGKKYSV
jgi:hypothetical protein